MKKILIAVTTLFGGGAERVATVWANELLNSGYDVYMLLYGRSEKEYPINKDVKIFTVADDYSAYRKLSYIERLCRMRKIVKEISPDVVISFLQRMQIWMMGATFGHKLRRIETIRVSPWHINISGRLEKILWKLAFHRADAVIFQTAEQAEFFSKSIQRKGVVVSNSLSEQCVKNPKRDYALKVRNFVAAGRITDQKNYPLMIKAFANAVKKYDDLHLSIYGIGYESYMMSIQNQIDNLGMSDNIKLMGRSTELYNILRESDAFIMTSDYEGMPNSLAESMVMGLPCISTNCRTGPKDMIEDGISGFLVDVGDEKGLTNSILKIADMNREQIVQMGYAARKKMLDLCGKEKSLHRLIDVIENRND